MLTSEDVGRRVVVRRTVGTAAGRPVFTDTIGELLRADETGLLVRPDPLPGRPDRTDVAIAPGQVVAAKPVPPRRRRVGAEELERIAAGCWPAPQTGQLGDWLLRAADGWTGRANSALVVGDPGVPLPAAVDAVVDWYRARDLRPACQLPLPGAEDVDAALAELGWSASVPVLVLTAPIDRVRRATRPAGLPAVRLSGQPDAQTVELIRAQRNSLPPAGLAVLTGGNPVFGEIIDPDGTLVAVGRATVVDGHLGVFTLEVTPPYRRLGLARQVLAALAEEAFDRAHTVFLQVQETNEAARALYDRLGFHVHHRYRYRLAPGHDISG